jgi:type VI secretion system protein ImpK
MSESSYLKISELARPILDAATRLRHPSHEVAAEPVHAHFKDRIRAFRAQARKSGFSVTEVEDMVLALVAFVDEAAASKPGAVRNLWLSRPLQLEFLDENTAGVIFFDRLAEIQDSVDSKGTLYVFFLCLALGYRGKFAMRGSATQLADITASVKDTLHPPDSGAAMSPDRGLPPPRRRFKRRGFVVWLPAAALVLSSLAFYGWLRVDLDRRSEAFESASDDLAQHLRAGHNAVTADRPASPKKGN